MFADPPPPPPPCLCKTVLDDGCPSSLGAPGLQPILTNIWGGSRGGGQGVRTPLKFEKCTFYLGFLGFLQLYLGFFHVMVPHYQKGWIRPSICKSGLGCTLFNIHELSNPTCTQPAPGRLDSLVVYAPV